VKITITADGTVESAEFIKGHPLFKEIAEAAARRWEFMPMFSND
jgi:outer membrane biosynthesis protein TonB